jgi:membrane protease YdiL (CAAX protease family)
VENQKTKVIPSLEAGLVIFLTFFLSVFVGAAILLTVGDGPALVIGELLILIIPTVYLLMKKVDIKSYVGINLKPKYILIGVGCAFLLLLLNIASSAALTAIFGTSQAVEKSNSLLSNLTGSPFGLIAVVLSLSLAGVCEEFALRGFLQNTLTRRYSFLPALLISAAVFGLFHFDPQFVYIIAAFISGLALGYIYHRTNYVTAATAHSVMNIIVLGFLMLGI